MGTGKKEKSRVARQGKVTGDPKTKGENFYRDAKRVKALNIRKGGGAQRNAEGKIVQAAAYQSREVPKAAIEPNRRWFTNTRVISQDTLTSFREAVAEKEKDPYSVLLKQNKLPMSLIRDQDHTLEGGVKKHKAKMTIEAEPFELTFGSKSQRKRPKIDFNTIDDLAANTEASLDSYKERLETKRLLSGQALPVAAEGEGEAAPEVEDNFGTLSIAKESIFFKGTSKRIWNELYKVLDSSDVILHVLDARDPEGTRCRHVEKYLATEAPHKHLIFVLNKLDLIPTKQAAAWIRLLSKDHPTVGFRAGINNSFGRGSLINVLKQFSILHKSRKQVSVGLVGYPNVGKSSVINCLKNKKVATVAPLPGETKVWQYITLMKRIFLIDCPGIVPPNDRDTPQQILLRGAVRVTSVDNPEQYIPAVLSICQKKYVERTYQITGWKDHIEFLEMLGRKGGRLLKGGEVDLDGVARMVLNHFLRGNLPWFIPAPALDEGADAGIEGREGRYGEMRKRKRDEEAAANSVETSPAAVKAGEGAVKGVDNEEDTFAGFDSDSDSEPEDGAENTAKASSAEDMIPLDDSSDEEAGELSGSEDGSDEEEELDDDISDIEGASDVADSEPEDAPVQKRRKKRN
ncbi:NUC091 domain-containing protein [Apodospora peruviana]|uniref:Nucleolar GTP-binding protein 2 n=1 Tax=Apodospora peruviana TaxID=516989 RepID=A0AAE0MF88_9PEZI|nr:NUC091 domain-containing protein [Apodospora peruviana]